MASADLPKDDLAAAVASRKDLGPDYEAAIVESFLDRVDGAIAARVDDRVAARLAESARRHEESEGEDKNAGLVLGIVSLGTGIPITAIAGGTADFPGLLVAWIGIALVNVAHALGRRPR